LVGRAYLITSASSRPDGAGESDLGAGDRLLRKLVEELENTESDSSRTEFLRITTILFRGAGKRERELLLKELGDANGGISANAVISAR